jgi:hypothetical protein
MADDGVIEPVVQVKLTSTESSSFPSVKEFTTAMLAVFGAGVIGGAVGCAKAIAGNVIIAIIANKVRLIVIHISPIGNFFGHYITITQK